MRHIAVFLAANTVLRRMAKANGGNPPISFEEALELPRRLGIMVTPTTKANKLAVDGEEATIFLNVRRRPRRVMLAAAHEVAEAILSLDLGAEDDSVRISDGELTTLPINCRHEAATLVTRLYGEWLDSQQVPS